MVEAIIRHYTRQAVRDNLYHRNTAASRKALKTFNKACRISNWIRRLMYL